MIGIVPNWFRFIFWKNTLCWLEPNRLLFCLLQKFKSCNTVSLWVHFTVKQQRRFRCGIISVTCIWQNLRTSIKLFVLWEKILLLIAKYHRIRGLANLSSSLQTSCILWSHKAWYYHLIFVPEVAQMTDSLGYRLYSLCYYLRLSFKISTRSVVHFIAF